jgi:DNA-binding response OmpR family regulator
MHDDIHFGSLILRAASRQFVTATGEIIRLTEKECGIVRFLYHNRPNVVTRHDLLSQVWGYNTNVTTHTLETHIYRLRQKLELDPTSARLLVTESGGYRLDI